MLIHDLKFLHQLPLFGKFFEAKLVRMWSSSKEVKHIIRVGSLIITVNENVWQKSVYLFTKAEMEFLRSFD